jgi:2-keto-3-deoxy-L-fuconate dehydrogenase
VKTNVTARLASKTALVTAAGQGVGRATTLAFAEEGASVWATDINETTLQSLAAERPGIRIRRLDVCRSEDVTRFAAEIGTIDILFNCAGFVHHGTILGCEEEDWDFFVRPQRQVNVPYLPRFPSGDAEGGQGKHHQHVFGSTKAAVIGLTKALAADFVRQGVRCNAICPGTVQSPSLNERIAAPGNAEKAYAEFVSRQPMGRLGRPEEVAALAVYLASDESAFTTGQIHIIDGGFSI